MKRNARKKVYQIRVAHPNTSMGRRSADVSLISGTVDVDVSRKTVDFAPAVQTSFQTLQPEDPGCDQVFRTCCPRVAAYIGNLAGVCPPPEDRAYRSGISDPLCDPMQAQWGLQAALTIASAPRSGRHGIDTPDPSTIPFIEKLFIDPYYENWPPPAPGFLGQGIQDD